jgi:hypothetical protein
MARPKKEDLPCSLDPKKERLRLKSRLKITLELLRIAVSQTCPAPNEDDGSAYSNIVTNQPEFVSAVTSTIFYLDRAVITERKEQTKIPEIIAYLESALSFWETFLRCNDSISKLQYY